MATVSGMLSTPETLRKLRLFRPTDSQPSTPETLRKLRLFRPTDSQA